MKRCPLSCAFSAFSPPPNTNPSAFSPPPILFFMFSAVPPDVKLCGVPSAHKYGSPCPPVTDECCDGRWTVTSP